jgi:hypothetical protein
MTVKVKTLSFSAKCSDCFGYDISDEKGNIVKEDSGYVPHDLGIGGGDYIQMDIDLATGQILNWKPITEIEVEEEI